MTAVLVKEPPVNYVSKGGAAFKQALIDPKNKIWMLTIGQAPTNGTSGDGAGWAGPGSLLIRYDTPKLYQNTNTTASPTWTVVGSET